MPEKLSDTVPSSPQRRRFNGILGWTAATAFAVALGGCANNPTQTNTNAPTADQNNNPAPHHQPHQAALVTGASSVEKGAAETDSEPPAICKYVESTREQIDCLQALASDDPKVVLQALVFVQQLQTVPDEIHSAVMRIIEDPNQPGCMRQFANGATHFGDLSGSVERQRALFSEEERVDPNEWCPAEIKEIEINHY